MLDTIFLVTIYQHCIAQKKPLESYCLKKESVTKLCALEDSSGYFFAKIYAYLHQVHICCGSTNKHTFNIIGAYLYYSPYLLSATEEEEAPFCVVWRKCGPVNSLPLPSGILKPWKGSGRVGSHGGELWRETLHTGPALITS